MKRQVDMLTLANLSMLTALGIGGAAKSAIENAAALQQKIPLELVMLSNNMLQIKQEFKT